MTETLPAVIEQEYSLAPRQQPVPPVPPIQEMVQIAELLAKSGYFKDVKDAAQAFTKMLRGWELGIGYATALAEIDVIQGKTVLSSALMARLVKSSGKYNYQVVEASAKACELEWFEFGRSVGRTRWTIEAAQAAGLAGKDTYKGFAEDMLFWRALSRGAKRFCADIFGGAVYAQGEIEAEERPLPPRVDEPTQDTPALPPVEAEREALIRRYGELRAQGKRRGVKVPALDRDMDAEEIAAMIEVAEAMVSETAEEVPA